MTQQPVMEIDEIRTKYPAEWVLVEDPELTDVLKVVRGRVIWHCRERDELYQKLKELRPRHPAIFFTGPSRKIYAL